MAPALGAKNCILTFIFEHLRSKVKDTSGDMLEIYLAKMNISSEYFFLGLEFLNSSNLRVEFLIKVFLVKRCVY